MKIAIIYNNIFDPTGTERKVGGIETYLLNLAKLIFERGDEPLLIQPALKDFNKSIDNIKVIGIGKYNMFFKNSKRTLNFALSKIDPQRDIIIFGADHISIHTSFPRTIAIQHGISWDLPGRFFRGTLLGKIPLIPDWLCKKYLIYRCRQYFENSNYRVCVDYNFLNWYRTQISNPSDKKIYVIPNFAETPSDYKPNLSKHYSRPLKVLFARRFVEHRGTRIMIETVKHVLKAFSDVEFCFAGEGPDKTLLLDTFKKEPRVSIKKYLPEESLRFHDSFQITVIPSLASEGTSLSLAEGMAAGCAVVASNVGGMTNMVIDGYNGLLVDPTITAFSNALIRLIQNPELCYEIGKHASDTARNAFSINRWKSRWSEVLNEVMSIKI